MIYDRKKEKNTPICPFCSKDISRPVVTKTDLGEILSGKCECNTIFVCDLTGRCVGEAYMEALVMLKGDWDIGVLDPDRDYSYADMDYDYRTHKKMNSASLGDSPGKLVFLKPTGDRKDLLKIDEHEEKNMMQRKGSQKKILKKLLQDDDLEKIVELALDDRGVINQLLSFSYDKNNVITWRAIESVGLISQELIKYDIEFIRNTARRLLWSMAEESGGVSWSAPEMLGEIIRSNPKEFSDLIPIVWSNRNEDVFREGAIWAMGRIAEIDPESINFMYQELKQMAEDANPTVRGYSIWVIGKIADAKVIMNDIERFKSDKSQINFYRNRVLLKITVGEIANETINIIS